MRSKKLKNGYILRLERGEEIIKTLTKFCEDKKIQSGVVAGVGAGEDVTLKYYDVGKKQYISKEFNTGIYEIISLNGNVSLIDGRPFLHLHIVLGTEDFQVFGGHLGSAVTAITCEITIGLSDDVVHRKSNDEFKLKFIDI